MYAVYAVYTVVFFLYMENKFFIFQNHLLIHKYKTMKKSAYSAYNAYRLLK